MIPATPPRRWIQRRSEADGRRQHAPARPPSAVAPGSVCGDAIADAGEHPGAGALDHLARAGQHGAPNAAIRAYIASVIPLRRPIARTARSAPDQPKSSPSGRRRWKASRRFSALVRGRCARVPDRRTRHRRRVAVVSSARSMNPDPQDQQASSHHAGNSLGRRRRSRQRSCSASPDLRSRSGAGSRAPASSPCANVGDVPD